MRLSASMLLGLLLGFSVASSAIADSLMPQVDPLVSSAPSATLPLIIPAAPTTTAKSYILVNAVTGSVIAEKDPDAIVEPASLTKLMALYVIFDGIKRGTIHLDDQVLISTKAWKMEGSRMFVKAGDYVPVDTLIQGVAIQSGNDATVALAEHLAGSESSFVDLMNMQAQRLGMKNTHFEDTSGLPSANHVTTARDLSILVRALIQDFPDNYHYFSEKWFEYANIKQPNRNRLLWDFEGADGLKTGHTEAAGYCLVSSALRNSERLISVVLGEPSDSARTTDSIQLLTYGFRFYHTERLYEANTPVTMVRVWQGEHKETALGVTTPLVISTPTGANKDQMKIEIETQKQLNAPIVKGQTYGTISITFQGKLLATAPLVALEDNPKGGVFRRVSDVVAAWFHKDEVK